MSAAILINHNHLLEKVGKKEWEETTLSCTRSYDKLEWKITAFMNSALAVSKQLLEHFINFFGKQGCIVGWVLCYDHNEKYRGLGPARAVS